MSFTPFNPKSDKYIFTLRGHVGKVNACTAREGTSWQVGKGTRDAEYLNSMNIKWVGRVRFELKFISQRGNY